MAEVTPEGIAKAMNAAGITAEQLDGMMTGLMLLQERDGLNTALVVLESQKAEMLRGIEDKRQSIQARITEINGELAKRVTP
jgi:hypothetical protein